MLSPKLLAGVLVASFISLAPGSSIAQEFKWDLADEYPATSLPGEANAHFAELVAERSDGRIEVTLHQGGALGFKSDQHWDMVADGAIPIANTPPHHLGGYAPILEIGSLPFLTATAEDARTLLDVAEDQYRETLRQNNQVLVAAVPWPPSGFWSREPVRTTEDIQNWKLRVFDASGQATMRAAGAAPIQLSWADIVPALSTGSIDGVLTSAEGGTAANFWDHLDYFTEINYALPLAMIHMNLDVWESLPPDLQEVVTQAGREVTDSGFEKLATRVQQNYEDMKANGMTIITDPDPSLLQTLRDAASESHERWIEKMGPEGSELLEEYRERTEG